MDLMSSSSDESGLLNANRCTTEDIRQVESPFESLQTPSGEIDGGSSVCVCSSSDTGVELRLTILLPPSSFLSCIGGCGRNFSHLPEMIGHLEHNNCGSMDARNLIYLTLAERSQRTGKHIIIQQFPRASHLRLDQQCWVVTFICPTPGCLKGFGNLVQLYQHVYACETGKGCCSHVASVTLKELRKDLVYVMVHGLL